MLILFRNDFQTNLAKALGYKNKVNKGAISLEY